jgi:hypothetical protein
MVKYYTPEEVALHNNADDCWVSIYEKIYNLTALIAANRGVLADPIIKSAGTSISHWFREDTKDVKTFIDPERNIRMPYTPHGRFIHVPSPDPTDNCAIIDTPWWVDDSYVIGQVSLASKLQCLQNVKGLSRCLILSLSLSSSPLVRESITSVFVPVASVNL